MFLCICKYAFESVSVWMYVCCLSLFNYGSCVYACLHILSIGPLSQLNFSHTQTGINRQLSYHSILTMKHSYCFVTQFYSIYLMSIILLERCVSDSQNKYLIGIPSLRAHTHIYQPTHIHTQWYSQNNQRCSYY